MRKESIQAGLAISRPGSKHIYNHVNNKIMLWLRSTFVGLTLWIVSAALFSWYVLAAQESPWFWLAPVWIFTLAAAAFYLHQTTLRIICINLAAVVFTLGIGEFWFGLEALQGPERTYTGDYTGDYFVEHDLLGYGPKPGEVATAQLTVDGRQIYGTKYSINPEGLRITPVAPDAESAVLFFGGSFTFGEGVSDDQSMPYRVGQLIGPKTKVYNFGFHGYGPHQMLAALEFGLVDSIVSQPVRVVVYQAIDSHVHRAAGRAFWDLAGPRYTLTETGDAVFTGHFDEGLGEISKWLIKILNKSYLYRRIFGVNSAMSDADISLFGAIVARSRDLVKVRFPDAEFQVLLWGYPDSQSFLALRDALTERGINVYPVSNILPEYETNISLYQLDAADTHPNALAHEIIAHYVADQLFANPQD